METAIILKLIAIVLLHGYYLSCINLFYLHTTKKQILLLLLCRVSCAPRSPQSKQSGSTWPCTSQRKLSAMKLALGAHLFPAMTPACMQDSAWHMIMLSTSQTKEFQAAWAHSELGVSHCGSYQRGKRGPRAQSRPQGRKGFLKLSYCFQPRRSKGRDAASKDNSSWNCALPAR